jgi:hypothetical protein
MDPMIVELQQRAGDPSASTDVSAELPRAANAPLDEVALSRAEDALGFELPPLLRDLYLLVGNGGFGPSYGLIRLLDLGEARDPLAEPDAVTMYAGFRAPDPEGETEPWPVRLLPICEWGDAIFSCLDCSSPEAPVWTFDANVIGEGGEMADALALTHRSLREWLEDWLSGVKLWDLMFEPDPERSTSVIDTVTGETMAFVGFRLRRQGPAADHASS